MTFDIPPDTEARLRAFAGMRGLEPEQALLALLYRALVKAEEEEIVAELRASEEDHEARRSMTVEEYKVRMRARRQARDAAKDK